MRRSARLHLTFFAFLVFEFLVGAFLVGACDHAPPAGVETAAMRTSAPARARREPRGPEHDVYSLVDNRLYAHVERGGGLLVVPGAPGFPKYLTSDKARIGWGPRELVDGRPVARARASAPLGVPLDEAQAAGGLVTIRLLSPSARKLTLFAGGRSAATAKLAAGWQTVSLALAAGTLHAGENDLVLAFEAAAGDPAVEWLQIGGSLAPPAPSAPPPPDDAAGPAVPTVPTIYDPARRALVLGDDVALIYYLAVPPGARLVADITGSGCRVTATAVTASGRRAQGTLVGEAVALDLGALAGEVARLRLSGSGCRSARLLAAALALPGPRLLAQHRTRPANIVLWVMDSLRADKVRAFAAGARPETPSFAALAERGVRFTAAYAPGNESRESYGSIWTGVYPASHGMTVPGQALDPALVTLAPAMRSAGLQTVGATGNGYVAARWGFGAGWDAFTNRIHDEGSTEGDEILGAGLSSLSALEPGRPFFLYLGTVDTHVSWRGKKPWLESYDPRPYDGTFKTAALGRDVERMGAGKLDVSARDKEHIIALYDSNVSFQDDLLGKLVADLDQRGVTSDTMLVITADHGDELWEDGRVGHGGALTETLVHVPLLVVYPPLFPAGTSVAEEVELVDLLPTLLDAAGTSAPEAAQGASLLPLAQGVGAGYPRGAVATQLETAHALRLFGWKARVGGSPGSAVPQIFHVAEDPLERQDLAATRPIERRLLTDVLSMHLRHRKEWRKGRWGAIANVSPQMADDLER